MKTAMRNYLKYTLLTRALLLSVATAATINVPDEYPTIQAALMAADSSDTVLVQPGTYYENIFWPDVNGIKLISAGDTSNTIIDGNTMGSTIYIRPLNAEIDSTTEIVGFKIVNGGNVNKGGGLYIYNSSLRLESIVVTDNYAIEFGGGMYIEGESPEDPGPILSHVVVRNNSASGGGGLFIMHSKSSIIKSIVTGNVARVDMSSYTGGGGILLSSSNSTLESVKVSGNVVDKTITYGGGIYIWYSAPNISNATIEYNTADVGGGVCIVGSGKVLFYNLSVRGNTARLGGGISVRNQGELFLENTYVEWNIAQCGGGIHLEGDKLETNGQVIISNNSASLQGGGARINQQGSIISGIQFVDNTSGDLGGGLYITNGNRLILENILISGNFAQNRGGGIYARGCDDLTIKSTSVVDNENAGGYGSIYFYSGILKISHSNIAHNGIGLYNQDNSNIIDADSIWWGDSTGPYHPTQNSNGLGDSVNAFVDVIPWLTEPDTTAPPIQVQNLAIDSTGYDFIGLSWDASPIGDLAGYRIYLDTDSSGFPYADSVDAGKTTSYMLTNLTPGQTYYIAVTCYDRLSNESWYSKEVNTTPKDITAPGAPQNLMVTPGDEQVILIWAKNTESDFLRYRIYGGTASNPIIAIDSTESALDTTITISGLNNDATYYFRTTAVDTALNESDFSSEVSATPTALAIEESSDIPASFALHPAYPNPFNPTATIRFDLPNAVDISIVVYDLLGREVTMLVDGYMEPGYHAVVWNGKTAAGRDVPSGIYIARLVTPKYTKSIKMVLLK